MSDVFMPTVQRAEESVTRSVQQIQQRLLPTSEAPAPAMDSQYAQVLQAYRGVNWQEIEQRETFANMSYSDQRIIRNDWFMANTAESSDFNALNDAERDYVYHNFMHQTPSLVFEDLTPLGQSFLQAGQEFQNMLFTDESEMTADQRIARSTLRQTAYNENFIRGSGMWNIGRNLGERFFPDLMNDPELGTWRIEEASVADQNAYEYMTSLAMQHEDLRKTYQRHSVAGNVSGLVFDVGTSLLLGAPIRKAAYIYGAKASAGMVAGKMGRFLSNSLVPEIIANVGEATFLTAAEVAREQYDNAIAEDPGVAMDASRVAMLFGRNFLSDMAMWGLFRTGGALIKGLATTYTRRGFRKAVSSAQATDSPAEVVNLVQKLLQDTDPRTMAQLPAGMQRREYNRVKTLINRAKRFNAADVGSDEWMSLILDSKGFLTRTTKGGMINVRAPKQISAKTKKVTYENLGNHTTMREAFLSAVDYSDNLMGAGTDIATTGAREAAVRVSVIETGQAAQANVLARTSMERFLTPATDGTIAPGNVKSALRSLTENSRVLREAGIAPKVSTMPLQDWRRIAGEKGAFFLDSGRPISASELFQRLSAENTPARVKARLRNASFVTPEGALLPEDVAALRRMMGDYLEAASSGLPAQAQNTAKRAAREIRRNSNVYVENSPATMKNLTRDLSSQGKQIVDANTGNILTIEQAGQLPVGSPLRIQQPDGSLSRVYNNSVEAYMSELDTSWMNKNLLRDHLKSNFGITLADTTDGRMVLKSGKNQIRSNTPFESIEDVLVKNPDLFPKRPLDQLTNDVVYDWAGGDIRFESGRVVGTPQAINEYMDGTFANYAQRAKERTVISTPAGEVKFTPGDPVYRVEMPELNFRKDFTSMDDAKTFLRKGVDDFDNLNEIAHVYGSEIFFNGDSFVLPTPDGNYATSRSLEGIRRHLKNMTDSTPNATDLLRDTGLPQPVLEQIAENIRQYAHPSFGTPRLDKEYALQQFIKRRKGFGKGQQKKRFWSAWTGGQERTIDLISSDIGDETLMELLFRGPMRAHDVFTSKYQVIESGVDRVFKGMSQKQVHAMTSSIMHPKKDPAQIFSAIGAEYTPRVQEAMTAARELFDMGRTQFGVDSFKFLSDYLPRIKRELHRAGNSINPSEPARRFFQNAGIDVSSPEVAFFAQNMRVKDIFELTSDSLYLDELLLTYWRKGLKSQYLTEPTNLARQKVTELFKAGTIDADMARYLNGFSMSMSGGIEDFSNVMVSQGLEDSINSFLTGVMKTDVDVAKKVGATLRQATIAAHMSGRPFLPIRNMSQIYTTLSWRLGNDAVNDGLQALMRDPQRYVKDLVDSNVITHGRAAILEMASEGARRGRLQKFNELGMLFYKNADDFNRAVSAVSSWIPYDKAVAQLSNNVIRPDDFLRVSRLDRLQPDLQRKILEFTEIGRHDVAKNILAKAWVDQTQFTYVGATNPQMFQSVWGKMFGHYGHWPTMFRDNLLNAFGSHVPTAVKVQQAAELALNTVGLYYFFEKGLGINATNFMPWNSLVTSGGPYYDLMNTALNSTRPGFRGSLARSQFGEQFARTFLPGGSFYFAYGQAKSLMDDGYTAEGILRAFSFPVIDPRKPTAR